jgi:ribonuclease HI
LIVPKLFGRGGNKSKSDRSNCTWIPPEEGWVKLNFDGASRGNPGVAGIGGIIRNWKGEIISKFSQPIKPTTNNMAECLAALEGLKICKRLNFPKLIIEGDSQIIINAIRTKKMPNWILNSKIEEINHILESFPEILVKHTYREGNSDADNLANLGANGISILE